MKYLALVSVCAACLAASIAMAQPSIRYLGPLDTMPTLDPIGPGLCAMGTADQPAAIIGPAPAYWVVQTFDPLTSACGCPEGFLIHSLHLVFAKMTDEATPVRVFLSLTDAYPQSYYGGECPWPSYCEEGYTLGFRCPGDVEAELTASGFYEAIVPVDCACVSQAWVHGLSIAFWPIGTSDLQLVTNDEPGHCPDWSWYSWMLGSCRWNEIAAPGHFVQWCEVSCCSEPVGAESISWGAVKTLYK